MLKFSVTEEASVQIGPSNEKPLLASVMSQFIQLHLAISQSKNSSQLSLPVLQAIVKGG